MLIHPANQAARAKGILVVAVTQCLRGGVSLGTYAVGVTLERNGVLSGGDMTTEAVVTKLAYLFGLTNNIQVRLSPGTCSILLWSRVSALLLRTYGRE